MSREKVFNEIYSELKNTKIVDVHQHLDPAALAPRTIDDIIFYHYIVTELIAAGAPRDKMYSLSGVERLRIALPYMKYIRSTATFWCLRKILSDLYGIDVREIAESNVDTIVRSIENALGNESRALDILKNKVPVYKSFLTLNPLKPIPDYDRDIFVGALRMDPLIPNLSKESLESLEKVSGVEIKGPKDLRESILNVLDKFRGHVKAVTISLQPDDAFLSLYPSENHVEPYLKAVRTGGVLDQLGRNTVYAYIFNTVAEYAKERRIVVQLMLGVKRPVPGADPHDYAITIANPNQLLDLALMLSRYPDVNFDIFVADATINHMLTVIAKNYPNVFLSGYWWYSMYPEIIRSYLRVRLQMLPYNKVGGFFSDAYVADWVYGKAALARSQIAHVLSEMVAEGFIDTELAIEIGRSLLYENAAAFYRL